MIAYFSLGNVLIRPDQIVAVEFQSETEARLFTAVGAFDVPIESQQDFREGLVRAYTPE